MVNGSLLINDHLSNYFLCVFTKKFVMFELIEFEESSGGGLSIVHRKWMTPRKTEVFWPPYKEELSRYNKAVKQGELVDEDKWQLYKIKRCFYSCGKKFLYVLLYL